MSFIGWAVHCWETFIWNLSKGTERGHGQGGKTHTYTLIPIGPAKLPHPPEPSPHQKYRSHLTSWRRRMISSDSPLVYIYESRQSWFVEEQQRRWWQCWWRSYLTKEVHWKYHDDCKNTQLVAHLDHCSNQYSNTWNYFSKSTMNWKKLLRWISKAQCGGMILHYRKNCRCA